MPKPTRRKRFSPRQRAVSRDAAVDQNRNIRAYWNQFIIETRWQIKPTNIREARSASFNIPETRAALKGQFAKYFALTQAVSARQATLMAEALLTKHFDSKK